MSALARNYMELTANATPKEREAFAALNSRFEALARLPEDEEIVAVFPAGNSLVAATPRRVVCIDHSDVDTYAYSELAAGKYPPLTGLDSPGGMIATLYNKKVTRRGSILLHGANLRGGYVITLPWQDLEQEAAAFVAVVRRLMNEYKLAN